MSVALHLADEPDPKKPSASLIYVTPEMAERWLAKNIRNRPLKGQKIEQFARDMAAGRWEITGEAVKFSTEGALLDGQNRLRAVVISQTTVPMFVVRGVAPSAQEVMDSGTPRSAADALGLRQYSNTKSLAAAASCFVGWKTGFYKNAMHQSTVTLTNSEVLEVIEQNPDLVDSTRYANIFRRSLPLPVGALATAHYELSRIAPDDLAEFFARVTDLRTVGKGDPVYALVKRTSEIRERRERIWTSTALFFIFRAWNAARSGEELYKFQLGSPLRGWVAIPEPK